METKISDFDLHGFVGIRLLNASPRDIVAVERQLGPIQKHLTRDPDIVISFVNQIPLSSPIRYLGVDDVGFTDDAFLVFRGKHKAHINVQIPFAQIGNQQCHIVCESDLPAIPLLIPIINLTALSKGILPFHASALIYNGKGILITGWSKGGKTETLLAFAAKGAEYVGDEWIYISNDGHYMYGIPEPIRIWYWHLQEMPQYKSMVKRNDLVKLQMLYLLVSFLEWIELSNSGNAGSTLFRYVRQFKKLAKQQLNVQIPPEKLFGQRLGKMAVHLEKVFFVASHSEPELIVQSITPQEIADRMVFSLQEERIEFMSNYLKYRFAFPKSSNPLIDQIEEIQRKMLLKVLAGKEAFAVYHPYPVEIPALFEVIHPYCA